MLTIFIGTFNRLDTLTRTIRSYRQFETPYQLVIVDNGSSRPQCRELLNEIECYPEVKKVYRLRKIDSMEKLTANYNIAISDQFQQHEGGDWYAVTDADICFEGTHTQALHSYQRLAEETGCAVGPHTRIDAGLPLCYPLRSRILSTESKLLYKNSMQESYGVYYSAWPIDTTFHLFPARGDHPRLRMNTLRCGPPFDAMHLDWYIDFFNPTEENKIYITKRAGVGSWGRTWIADFFTRFQRDPKKAFEYMRTIPRNLNDLCITSFILSWCYQVGAGCEQDMAAAERSLHEAIPLRFIDYWTHLNDSKQMIFENNFSCLGW